jgi:hypothetical protein
MTVQDAQQTLDDLREKLIETEAQTVLLEAERSQISYGALVEADPRAIKRLETVSRELLALGQDAASVQAAISEAERRVSGAKADELREIERAKGEQARKFGKQAREHAKALDETARLLFEHFARFWAVMVELRRIGAGPNPELVESACQRALVAASMNSRLKLGHLAPSERRTFLELSDRWAEGIEAFVVHRLDEKEKDAA